jgi:hypothetical protein
MILLNHLLMSRLKYFYMTKMTYWKNLLLEYDILDTIWYRRTGLISDF